MAVTNTYVAIYQNRVFDKGILSIENVDKTLNKAYKILDYQHDSSDINLRLCSAGYSIEEYLLLFIIITHDSLYRSDGYRKQWSIYKDVILQSEREDKISDLID